MSKPGLRMRRGRQRPGVDTERNGDPKSRTAPDFAFHFDPPAHHLAQAPHDRKTEPGAPKRREMDASAWVKPEKNRAELGRPAIPMPLSATEKRSHARERADRRLRSQSSRFEKPSRKASAARDFRP